MKIAFLDDWTNDGEAHVTGHRLAQEHDIVIFTEHLTGDALITALQPFDIIAIMRERTKMDDALLSRLPNLKAIVTPGMANAAIDLAACKARNIIVSGSPSPGHATAELAMTLIGALARQIVPNHNEMKAGGWQIAAGSDLRGATLGVLGLGRLGQVLAGLGKAYGMDVVAWSQNLTQDAAEAHNVRYLDKENFFKAADYISIHLKLSDRVRGLIGAPELALMKPTAFLVNTSRAPIIHTSALLTALIEGQIAGAALDVYDSEPVPADDIVRNVPNLLLSPHIGYVTHQTMAVFYQNSLESIDAIIDGSPIRVLTN